MRMLFTAPSVCHSSRTYSCSGSRQYGWTITKYLGHILCSTRGGEPKDGGVDSGGSLTLLLGLDRGTLLLHVGEGGLGELGRARGNCAHEEQQQPRMRRRATSTGGSSERHRGWRSGGARASRDGGTDTHMRSIQPLENKNSLQAVFTINRLGLSTASRAYESFL